MLRSLTVDEPSTRQTGMYLFGSLAKHGQGAFDDVLMEMTPNFLEAMTDPSLQTPRFEECVENGASAIFYVALFSPAAGVSMEDALETLVQVLPFTRDLLEAERIYTHLCEMIASPESRASFSPEQLGIVLVTFANAIGKLTDEANLRDCIAESVSQLKVDEPAIFEAAMSTLDEDESKLVNEI